VSHLCGMQFDTITGTALLTDRQKSWRNTTKQALGLKPIRPKEAPVTPFKVHPYISTIELENLEGQRTLKYEKLYVIND